jgi:hypothetical protein
MSARTPVGLRPLAERALEVMRREGNPFRNYFARNPDDEVCARYHVPELFATEREQLLGVVDLYRYDTHMHSEVVPVLGNKGSGKTHLLFSIKHGGDAARQLLVTPGVYQKDTDFLEYLLFQIIDTLLSGGEQKGTRPLEFVGEELTRRLLAQALAALTPAQRLELFPAPGLGRWMQRIGLGSTQAQEKAQWLLDSLNRAGSGSVANLCTEANLTPERACELICGHAERNEGYDTAGLMRLHIHQGFARATLLGDEADLANFLTFGFAELEFQIRPSRQDLVLALARVLMEVLLGMKIPVVVAFDQLEDLLLARRTQEGHRIAESFFAGIVQSMHQIDGLCFLIFAERGLWNRFVPSLDGYIRDRLNNPIHVPRHGTIKALRLEPPHPDLVRCVVEARLRPALEELPDFAELPAIFPFTSEQVNRVARSEPTLRDMLQQFRHLFDHLVYGAAPAGVVDPGESARPSSRALPEEELPPAVKSVIVVETPENNGAKAQEPLRPMSPAAQPHAPAVEGAPLAFGDVWDQAMRAALRKIEPQGSLTGATRELQSGLGSFLQVCHEHGVKVGPWRLNHVVPELSFGDHPTYGVVTIAQWVCKDGQPWKVGIGLFLGRGPGKPKDLQTKLASLEAEPAIIDHLILLRPEDDLTISGKSKTVWQEAEKRGRHVRMEPVSHASFATLYGFPRFLAALTETLPEGQPLPNLADLIQARCPQLLQQVCMPVQQ